MYVMWLTVENNQAGLVHLMSKCNVLSFMKIGLKLKVKLVKYSLVTQQQYENERICELTAIARVRNLSDFVLFFTTHSTSIIVSFVASHTSEEVDGNNKD